MRILIRADASATIGTGHMMRCFALAQAVIDHGGEVRFRSSGLPEAFVRRLAEEGIALIDVAETPGSTADAEATHAAATEWSSHWLVVDGYHLDERFETKSVRTLRIDDQEVPTTADLFLNQNLGGTAHPGTREALLGPEYALLRREFGAPRSRRSLEQNITCLVTFGGADPKGLTARILTMIANEACPSHHFVVVVGGANPQKDALVQLAEGIPNVEVLVAVADMVPLLDDADYAITAGGSTMWELAARRLPAILIAAGPVEEMFAEVYAETGAAEYVGVAEEVSDSLIAARMARIGVDAELRDRMSAAASYITDGHGADRVVARMMAKSTT